MFSSSGILMLKSMKYYNNLKNTTKILIFRSFFNVDRTCTLVLFCYFDFIWINSQNNMQGLSFRINILYELKCLLQN